MKATLEFNLPDEFLDHKLAVNAGQMAATISDAMRSMRDWLKYGHEFKTPTDAIEACQKLFVDINDLVQG
jgi:hypothetical protein